VEGLRRSSDDPRGRWVQPFLRSGIVALSSEFEAGILSDANEHVIEFYKRVQNERITPESVREFLSDEREVLLSFGNRGLQRFEEIVERSRWHGNPLDLILLDRTIRLDADGVWQLARRSPDSYWPRWWASNIVRRIEDMASLIQPGWSFLHEPWRETLGGAETRDLLLVDVYWIGAIPLSGRKRGSGIAPALGRNIDKAELWNLLCDSKAALVILRRHFERHGPDLTSGKYFADFVMNSPESWKVKPGFSSRGWFRGRPPAGERMTQSIVYNFPCLSTVPAWLGEKWW